MTWYPDYGTAMAMSVVSLVMWGSWTVSMKIGGIGDNTLAVFILDYALGMLVSAVAFAGSLGWIETPTDNTTTLSSIQFADPISIFYAVAAGLVFNVSNTMLLVGINIAGMAVAFPLGIGLSFAVGTLLTYAVQPDADPCFMFPGVVVGVLAVVAIGISYHFKMRHDNAEAREAEQFPPSTYNNNEKDESLLPPQENNASRAAALAKRNKLAIIACGIGGLIMGTWSPLSAKSQAPGQLTPYASFLFYILAAAISMPLMSLAVQRTLGDANQRCFQCSAYCRLSCLQHVLGFLGGVAWAIGTVFNMISGNVVG